MSAHTPGPWQAKTRNIYGGGGRIVAQAHWPVVPGQVTSEEPSAEELAANIALLTAAPDLLGALEHLTKTWEMRFTAPPLNTHPAAIAARAAITKATGGGR